MTKQNLFVQMPDVTLTSDTGLFPLVFYILEVDGWLQAAGELGDEYIVAITMT